MKKNKLKKQTSETFRLSAILAISGGFQDAYTYNVRDEVFSNAQTGNVVLMSQNFMSGEWLRGLHYLFPIIAFALGVFVAERIQKKLKYVKRIHWRQIIVLMELAILFIVGLIPGQYNMTATMLVSFACSMQVQTFRKVNGYGYASTMCIGNLRSGTESLSIYLREKKAGNLKKSTSLLRYNTCFCNRCRYRRNFIIIYRYQSYMGIINSISSSIYNDVYRKNVIFLKK